MAMREITSINPSGYVESALEYLASFGITTSIAFGPCGNKGILYSVDVLTPDFDTFEHPYGAKSLEQAAWIALLECFGRGWLANKAIN